MDINHKPKSGYITFRWFTECGGAWFDMGIWTMLASDVARIMSRGGWKCERVSSEVRP